MNAPTPLNLIAELTYRCPLQCPYCSNPINLAAHKESLSADDWGQVFDQASALGIVHVGLTGGEPSARNDLEEILERAVAADLYTHLVTAGLPLDPDRLEHDELQYFAPPCLWPDLKRRRGDISAPLLEPYERRLW